MDRELKYGVRISLLSEDDGGGYFIEVPDLPGCMADGDTLEEAIANIKQAIEIWIKAAKEVSKAIPEPKYYTDEGRYSGKLTVRMPKDLHRELAQAAEEQGVSINQLIIYYLAKGIGKDSIAAGMSKEIGTMPYIGLAMRSRRVFIKEKEKIEEKLWPYFGEIDWEQKVGRFKELRRQH